MRTRVIGSSSAAAVLSIAVVAFGQAANQTPTQSPVQSGTQSPGSTTSTRPGTQTTTGAAAAPLTLVGCIERGGSADFVLMSASAGDRSPAGAAGTTGNVSPSVGGSTSAGSGTGTTAGSRVGTTASTAGGHQSGMYRLTGSQDLSKYVGQRVEIVGTIMPPAPNRSATGVIDAPDPTASASAPSRDRDRDTTLDRIERSPSSTTADTGAPKSGTIGTSGSNASPVQSLIVTSVRPASGACK